MGGRAPGPHWAGRSGFRRLSRGGRLWGCGRHDIQDGPGPLLRGSPAGCQSGPCPGRVGGPAPVVRGGQSPGGAPRLGSGVRRSGWAGSGACRRCVVLRGGGARSAPGAGRGPATGTGLGQWQVHRPGRCPPDAARPPAGCGCRPGAGIPSAAAGVAAAFGGGDFAETLLPGVAHPGAIRYATPGGRVAAVRAGRDAGLPLRPGRGRPAHRPPLAGAPSGCRRRVRDAVGRTGAAGGGLAIPGLSVAG